MATDEVAAELARQSFEEVKAVKSTVGALEVQMSTVLKNTGETRDDVNAMKGTMEDLKGSSRDTATASIKAADIAEAKEQREAAAELKRDKANSEQLALDNQRSARFWKFVENNWKIVAVIIVLVASGNSSVILQYLGMAPVQEVVVTTPAPSVTPAPVVAPVPEPVSVP